MITVHHLNNSRSQRLLWLLEEWGVPYEIKHYQRNAKTMLAPPELKAVHPLGKSPVITDDGVVIAESGNIIEHIVEKYGQGRMAPAPGSADYQRYRYWMHYAEGTLMPLMVMALLFGSIEKRSPLLIRPIAKAITGQVKKAYLMPNITANLDYIESELGRSEWLAGNQLTAADMQMCFPLEAAAARGGMGERYPRIKAYLERCHARPAYKRGLEKGGPYALLTG